MGLMEATLLTSRCLYLPLATRDAAHEVRESVMSSMKCVPGVMAFPVSTDWLLLPPAGSWPSPPPPPPPPRPPFFFLSFFRAELSRLPFLRRSRCRGGALVGGSVGRI